MIRRYIKDLFHIHRFYDLHGIWTDGTNENLVWKCRDCYKLWFEFDEFAAAD